MLLAQLAELGRVEWVDEACEELRQRPASGTNPDEAWTRLKDVRGLRPRARAVAQSVAAWRERTAMQRNIPVRQVLPDLAVLGIAQRQPTNEKELSQARGVDERFSRGKPAAEILGRRRRGQARRAARRPSRGRRPRARSAPGGDARVGVGQPGRPDRADRRLDPGDPLRPGRVPRPRPRRPPEPRLARRSCSARA